MSITRWGCDGSDVYVYDCEGGFCCCDCHRKDGDFIAGTASLMFVHLVEHKRNGDCVPSDVFATLRQRMADGF